MQEVIVYRNPVEAAFWSGMTDGSMVPIFAALLAFPLTLVLIYNLMDKVNIRRVNFLYKNKDMIAMVLSAAASYFTFNALAI